MVNEILNKLERVVCFDTDAKRAAMEFVIRMSALPGLFVPKIRSYERDTQVNLIFEKEWRRIEFFVHEDTRVFCRQEWHPEGDDYPLVDDWGEVVFAFTRDDVPIDTDEQLTELWNWLRTG